MTDIEYYFFEWLIIQKKVSSEKFESLTENELNSLKLEFAEAYRKAIIIKL